MILSSNSGEVYGQGFLNVEVKAVSNVDVCGNKIFQIYIQTNEIYASDSIVGYDLYLGYNPEKIQLDQILASNTLSSQLQSSNGESSLTLNKNISGEVWISGAYFVNNKFIKGSQPLIALSGRYLKDCSDTTEITVLDYIPAYYDFSRIPPEIRAVNLKLTAEIANLGGREFQTNVLKDLISLTDTDTTTSVEVYLQNDDVARTKSVNLTIVEDLQDNLEINNVVSTQKSFHIDSLEKIPGGYFVKASISDAIDKDAPSFKIEYKRISVNSDTITTVIKIQKLSECNCIKNIRDDSFKIGLQGKIVGVSIQDSEINDVNSEIHFNKNSNFIEIKTNKKSITHIDIYNALGQLVEKVECSDMYARIPVEKLTNGLNIIELFVENNNIVNKKLIKYIK